MRARRRARDEPDLRGAAGRTGKAGVNLAARKYACASSSGLSPAEYLYLIGLVEETGSRPDWVRTWAQRRMLSAGHASGRLFALAWGEEGKLR